MGVLRAGSTDTQGTGPAGARSSSATSLHLIQDTLSAAVSLGGECWEGGDCVMMTTAAVGCMQGIRATSCSSTLLLLLTKTFSVLVTIHLNSAWPCFISANFVCCSASEYFIFTTQHRELVSKVSNSI